MEIPYFNTPCSAFIQVCMQVNDCQVSFFCMNQEEISIKVHRPLSYTELLLYESYTLTYFSKLHHSFTTLNAHPFDLDATLSTLQSPDAYSLAFT